MINPSIKLLLVLVALLICPGVAASGGDCDDPLGGGSNCQNQDLNSDDGPSGGDECSSPIVVAGASSSGTTLIVDLSNPTASTEEGFVVATVLLAGYPYGDVVPVSVTAQSRLSSLVKLPGTFTTIGVVVCANRPGGINEGPDVVGRHDQ